MKPPQQHSFSSSNTVFNIVFTLIILYQQYNIFAIQYHNSIQQQQLQKIFTHDVSLQEVLNHHVFTPEVNVMENRILHMKSPKPQTSEREAPSKEVNRNFYGGKGDAEHLGGFTTRDNATISENLWNFMLSQLAVKSFIDVGCGKGFSSSYFLSRGARVLCVEGSRDAIQNSLLPFNNIIQHDFSRGAWWPEETFDVAWSTEFLEHVGRQYMKNYMPAFAKSALVMVTASGWGGWHHVEVHDQKWWIGRFLARGFVFSKPLTEWIRAQASAEFDTYPLINNQRYAQILAFGLMVSVSNLKYLMYLFMCSIFYLFLRTCMLCFYACMFIRA